MWRWWRRSASMLVVSCLLMLGASSVQAAKVKITWMTTMWKVNEPLHLQIIDEFNGSQDRIEVTMEPIASNDAEAETILLRIAAGTPPDMVDFHPRYFYPFVRNGVLVDIEPFLKEDKRFGLDDFFPAVLESMRVGGTLYGLPQRISVYLYEFDPAPFRETDEVAGYYQSTIRVRPLAVHTIAHGLGTLLEKGVELRILPTLWHLREAVLDSSLAYSIIRMRNAAPHPPGFATAHPVTGLKPRTDV
jgi:hypothetical protein